MMLSKKCFILLLLILHTTLLPAEELFFSKVYRQNSNRQQLLFYHYNNYELVENTEILQHFYVLPDSTISVIDEVVMEDGEFKSSKSQFLEVDETGIVNRNGNKMTMIFQKNGKVKQKELNYPPDLLVGPLFNDHIRQNWQSLISGEKIDFKLPAPDILSVATFTFQKVDNSGYEKSEQIVFKLDVASIFLKLLVKPSYFVYDLSSQRLLSIHGTTILRTKQKGKWQNSTDVDMYYEYGVNK